MLRGEQLLKATQLTAFFIGLVPSLPFTRIPSTSNSLESKTSYTHPIFFFSLSSSVGAVRASSIFPILSVILLFMGGLCIAASEFYKSRHNIILSAGILFVSAGESMEWTKMRYKSQCKHTLVRPRFFCCILICFHFWAVFEHFCWAHVRHWYASHPHSLEINYASCSHTTTPKTPAHLKYSIIFHNTCFQHNA